MGRMGDIDQEDTPPNVVIDEFRSDSPAIKISDDQKKIDDKDTNVAVQTVPCSKCNRYVCQKCALKIRTSSNLVLK